METEGFFDLMEVEAVGNMAQDQHTVYTGISKPQMIDCTKPDPSWVQGGPKPLMQLALEYLSAKEAFENCSDMLRSHSIPPESQAISDRYFAARKDLEAACAKSDDSLAQEYYKAAQRAHETHGLMLDRETDQSDECARRMEEYYDVEERFLESMSQQAGDLYSDLLETFTGRKPKK
jgi:hypothetical protein